MATFSSCSIGRRLCERRALNRSDLDPLWGVVELVHTSNGHAGRDAAWRDVSHDYYGIMRTDVISLLKRCDVCVSNPRKRPKGGGGGFIQTRVSPDRAGLEADEHQNDNELPSLVDYDDNSLVDFSDTAMP